MTERVDRRLPRRVPHTPFESIMNDAPRWTLAPRPVGRGGPWADDATTVARLLDALRAL